MDQVIINRELLRQVLDAFETYAKQYPHMWKGYLLDAEQALRKALEQPAVKPVAWIRREARSWLAAEGYCTAYSSPPCDHPVPLYTAPQAQQPAEVPFLTDKEILEMANDGVFLGNVKEIARAVESAVRKKAGLK